MSPREILSIGELNMLKLYCERAGLQDGMNVIDLGCGWGSVTLFLAEKYPNMKITSISNSNSQREYINGICAKKGFKNVTVFTGIYIYIYIFIYLFPCAVLSCSTCLCLPTRMTSLLREQ